MEGKIVNLEKDSSLNNGINLEFTIDVKSVEIREAEKFLMAYLTHADVTLEVKE